MSLIKQKEINEILSSYAFITEKTKKKLLDKISFMIEHSCSHDINILLKSIYNIITILGEFNCEQVFTNGRVTFKQDNYLIFYSLVGNFNKKEVTIFDGCTIYQLNNSTYIQTNLYNKKQELLGRNNQQSFDFRDLVTRAITPAEISITINNIYYPNLIDKLLLKLR